MTDFLPATIAVAGSFISGYAGVKVALARSEERHIALSARVDGIDEEIGDRGSGIRGQLHKHHNWLGKHAARLLRLEEKAGIPPWEDKE